jgi:hypothetical protein
MPQRRAIEVWNRQWTGVEDCPDCRRHQLRGALQGAAAALATLATVLLAQGLRP